MNIYLYNTTYMYIILWTHLSGVCGVDHAVVPQARGGIVTLALLLVLVQDGLLIHK